MPHTFTRQELYDLVWTRPVRKLAEEFGLSDVGLAKACKKANIPRPPRGYWAKLTAGKSVTRRELPARGPGMSDKVCIGRRVDRYYSTPTKDEILNSDPEPPVFGNKIADVAELVRNMVPRVTVPRLPEKAHPQIHRLLDEEEERVQKQSSSEYVPTWERPIFDDRFEKRRLRVLNAIVEALQRAGMRPYVKGREGRDLYVSINDTAVTYTLDSASQKHEPVYWSPIETRGSSNSLRLVIKHIESCTELQSVWEDTDGSKLEKHLTDIVVTLITAGELSYRQDMHSGYRWRIERKARLLAEIRREKEEAERKERERVAAEQRARLEKLRADARGLRESEDIRKFVARVLELGCEGEIPLTEREVEKWGTWALAQADQIDPIRSGRFIEGMQQTTTDSET